jgi:hypothetical protein
MFIILTLNSLVGILFLIFSFFLFYRSALTSADLEFQIRTLKTMKSHNEKELAALKEMKEFLLNNGALEEGVHPSSTSDLSFSCFQNLMALSPDQTFLLGLAFFLFGLGILTKSDYGMHKAREIGMEAFKTTEQPRIAKIQTFNSSDVTLDSLNQAILKLTEENMLISYKLLEIEQMLNCYLGNCDLNSVSALAELIT